MKCSTRLKWLAVRLVLGAAVVLGVMPVPARADTAPLDPTFGCATPPCTGTVLTDFSGGFELLAAVVRQPDGGDRDFLVARFNPDGSLDTTFGAGGKVTTDFTPLAGGFDRAFALVLQPDGRLVAAGAAGAGGVTGDNFALARYLPHGGLDPAFGLGGKVSTDLGGVDDASALLLQPDGTLVAAGIGGATDDFVLVRYHVDGTRDGTFDVGGAIRTEFGGFDFAHGLVRHPDGKLIAAGLHQIGTSGDFALARYIVYDLWGFYQLVEMAGRSAVVFNLVRAGATVPLKFEAFSGDTEVADPALPRPLQVEQVTCDATAAQDLVTAAAGGTGLRYDAGAGQFVYNWKTPQQPGACFRVTVATVPTGSGSVVAYFKLR